MYHKVLPPAGNLNSASILIFFGEDLNCSKMFETSVVAPPKNDERFFAPVGLDIGGNTHQSIALSICAQIEAKKNGKI